MKCSSVCIHEGEKPGNAIKPCTPTFVWSTRLSRSFLPPRLPDKNACAFGNSFTTATRHGSQFSLESHNKYLIQFGFLVHPVHL